MPGREDTAARGGEVERLAARLGVADVDQARGPRAALGQILAPVGGVVAHLQGHHHAEDGPADERDPRRVEARGQREPHDGGEGGVLLVERVLLVDIEGHRSAPEQRLSLRRRRRGGSLLGELEIEERIGRPGPHEGEAVIALGPDRVNHPQELGRGRAICPSSIRSTANAATIPKK